MTYSRATSNYRKPLTAASFIEELRQDGFPHLPPEERTINGKFVTMSDLRITDKDGNLIPLTPNQEQRRYCEELGIDPENPIIKGYKLREIILKGRQQGFSTWILALIFLDTVNNYNRRSIIAAHSLQSTSNIFDMVWRFHDQLPKDKQRPIKGDKKKHLWYADTDSRIEIGTAGTRDLGSGSTYHNVVKSERAKWEFADPKDLKALDASLDAAGKEGNIWQESTAKGRNHFESDYNLARNGQSNYKARFFPWFEHAEYTKPCPTNIEWSVEEQQKMRDYNLTPDQMYWYRIEAIGEFHSLAAQEYPFNEEEAFVSSAHGYFNPVALRALNDRLKSSDYDPLNDVSIEPDIFPLLREAYEREYDNGEYALDIWELPKVGRTYVIPADVARGDGDEGDFDCADVYDTQTMRQVAQLWGKWDVEFYAELLFELGSLYNWGLLAPERTGGYGWNVTRALKRLGYPDQKGTGSSGLYHYDASLITETRRPKSDVLQAGWDTNQRSKPFALGKLNTFLIKEAIEIQSRRTVREMFNFVRKPGGELEAEGTAHDDCVMTAAIGAALLSLRFDPAMTSKRENLPEQRLKTAYGGRGRR